MERLHTGPRGRERARGFVVGEVAVGKQKSVDEGKERDRETEKQRRKKRSTDHRQQRRGEAMGKGKRGVRKAK